MVVVPPGKFVMGSTKSETDASLTHPRFAVLEWPRHEVTVAHPPAFGKYVVTFAEFDRFVKATHYTQSGGCHRMENKVWILDPAGDYRHTGFAQTDRSPAVCIALADAEAYVKWLSEKTGHHYRLPTEAELEYAQRGGTTTRYWWGESDAEFCKYANIGDLDYEAQSNETVVGPARCHDGFGAITSPVGSFPPNPFGLYDVLGNVLEWTEDCFTETYDGAPSDASVVVTWGNCAKHPVRAASWHNDPPIIRSAHRYGLEVESHASSAGFRVVRDPD
jgi:formylglycine-generating enzyme required for sulfatase activity